MLHVLFNFYNHINKLIIEEKNPFDFFVNTSDDTIPDF